MSRNGRTRINIVVHFVYVFVVEVQLVAFNSNSIGIVSRTFGTFHVVVVEHTEEHAQDGAAVEEKRKALIDDWLAALGQ